MNDVGASAEESTVLAEGGAMPESVSPGLIPLTVTGATLLVLSGVLTFLIISFLKYLKLSHRGEHDPHHPLA